MSIRVQPYEEYKKRAERNREFSAERNREFRMFLLFIEDMTENLINTRK